MRTKKLWLTAAASFAALTLVAGCSADPGTSNADPVDLGGGEPGAAEDTKITVAIPFPDINMYSMYEVASAKGWYEEEGLEVEVITADNVAAAVSSGSADVGVESAGAVIEAMRSGVPIELLAGHFCRQNFDFATQPDITEVGQLDGTSVVLAGTPGDPAEFQRALALKEAGWDLDTVDVDIVYPGPDSSTWVEFFVNDRVSLTPFYGDNRSTLDEYGANIVLESLQNWANDFHLAGTDWLAENPNSAVRFLRATMKGVEFILAPESGQIPANEAEVFDIMSEAGFEDDVAILEAEDHQWTLGGHLMCSNLYVDEAAWDETIETQQLEPLPFSENVDLSYLERAQDLLGFKNDPPTTLPYPDID